jgi:outer membrane immunogenic protein
MKKLALHVAASSVLLAGAASAADIRMPVKAPPPVPVAVFSWTGCYVGAGGGYGMWDQHIQYDPGGPFTTNDVGGRGWFATVQAGCDYQVSANIVIGAFADYDFSGMKGQWANIGLPFTGKEKHKSSWAAGGRIGWIPFQESRLLVYVSGGYTQARFDGFALTVFNGQPTPLSVDKATYDGWFLGAGYEYGLGFLPGLFWKTEYRFADYGTERVARLTNGVPAGDFFDQHKFIHTIRSELVWRFNAGGAAVSAGVADGRRSMPVKAPAPAPVAAYNWTGCYVGAGGGYGMWNQQVQFIGAGGVLDGLANDVSGRGWFGTVQAGCDYQAGSNIVIGAFGDYDFSGMKGDWMSIRLVMAGDEKHKSSWAGGGRIGWTPFQASAFLVYASGGYSQARFDGFAQLLQNGVPIPGLTVDKHTYSGWFLGAGYEYGLGFLPGLFWKTEYRFADYGTERVARLVNGVPDGTSFDHEKYIQTVRSELVWRFNFGRPVVARY